MINKIWIYTKNKNRFKIIKKLYELEVEVFNTKEIDNKVLYLVKEEDFNKIEKYVRYKFYIYDVTGLNKIKKKMGKLRLYIISVIFGVFLLFFLSNIIVDVEIIHSKKEIRALVKDELESYGIKRLTIKKDFEELKKVKDKVLENNKEKIEWLEIENVGMKYIVRVEERIIVSPKEEAKYCHVISAKDGQIISMQVERGIQNKLAGSYVKKGDILISGDILLNEEVVENVCAKGRVYGEVWYTINVVMPTYYEKKTKTGKSRYNIMLKHNNQESIILRSRLKDKEVSSKKILGFLGYDIYFQKEQEIKRTKHKYSESELLNEAINEALDKLDISLSDNPEILSQKVLKKSINNSKIEIELFVAIKEQIGVMKKIN